MESRIVLALCAVASLSSILWSWHTGSMMNYGDAVAHLHIARRVFDARLVRMSLLGSVWLPLPHILIVPFARIYAFWANGIAGVIPSALAYLASCLGMYRLARNWLTVSASACVLAFFALNPNLLYLQTTAMTEPLFIAEMVWAVVWLVEWRSFLREDPKRSRHLLCCLAVVLIMAIYTRYDGWIMAAIAWTGIAIVLLRYKQLHSRTFWIASVFLLAAPAAWFLYNAMCFEDWLAFLRGPYSAKAIEMRTYISGSGPPHPGWHNPWVALLFFLKAAELDTAAAAWGNTLLAASSLGTLMAWFRLRKKSFGWALLLWLPVPFYAYSVAYGSVPIFLPTWWPYSHYNLRYGMELLPALALGLGFIAQSVLTAASEFKPMLRNYAAVLFLACIALNSWHMILEEPLVYAEGIKNIQARLPYDQNIPPALRQLLKQHPGAVILMDTSVYPELVSLTGIPLKQTINESDLYLYTDALAAPAEHAQIVLAFDGDEIDRAIRTHPGKLQVAARFTAPRQRPATLYTCFPF